MSPTSSENPADHTLVVVDSSLNQSNYKMQRTNPVIWQIYDCSNKSEKSCKRFKQIATAGSSTGDV